MNSAARLSMLVGAGLLTVGLGAGPASAATTGPQPPHKDVKTAVGYFRSQNDCDWVGRVGDTANRWNGPECVRVLDGIYRGWWRLDVDRYGNTSWPGNPGHGGPGGPGHH